MAMEALVHSSKNIQLGAKAPEFVLPCDNQGEFILKEMLGKNVILYFYPKDDTPGCTQESKDFRDYNEEFNQLNTVIVGISKDSVDSHDKFKSKYCLPFTLASDQNLDVLKAYNVWVEKSMFGKKYFGIDRTTILIDSEGIIKKIWKKVKVNGHVKEVLNAVREI